MLHKKKRDGNSFHLKKIKDLKKRFERSATNQQKKRPLYSFFVGEKVLKV